MSETTKIIEYVGKTTVDAVVKNTAAHLAAKINKSQGTENANKVLGIGSDGAVSPIDARPNWNENDESNPSFIQNKPFSCEINEEIIFEQNIPSSSFTVHTVQNEMCATTVVTSTKTFSENGIYNVIYDGTLYSNVTVSKYWLSIVIGNIDESGTPIFTTYPFVLMGANNNIIIVINNTEPISHYIKIVEIVENINELDEKYIPDTIARTSDLESHIEESNERLTALEALETVVSNKADAEHTHSWNDLEDKPFGEEIGLATIIPETNVTATGTSATTLAKIDGINSSILTKGQTYTVTFDGIEYEVTSAEDSLTGGQYLGNILGMTGDYPFCILDDVDGYSYAREAGVYLIAEAGEHTVKVETESEVLVKLDEKYLPDHTHSWNDLTDKPFGTKELEYFYNDAVTVEGTTATIYPNRSVGNGDTYQVYIWGSSAYDGTMTSHSATNYGINQLTFESGNIPIESIMWNASSTNNEYTITFTQDMTGTFTLQVYELDQDIIDELDEQFIPDTIARTSDLETHVEESNERLTALEESSFYSPYPVLRVGKDLSYNLFPAIIVDVGELVPGTVYRERPEDYSMVSFVVVCDDGTEKYICSHWVYNEIRTTQAQSGSDDELNQWDIIMYINNSRYVIDVLDKSTADNVTFTVAYNTDYLSTSNTSEYSPTSDYNPATKKYVDEAINEVNEKASAQADWNVNDESAVDYVKNRPFYAEDPITVFEWTGSVDGLETATDAEGNVVYYRIADYVSKEDMLYADVVLSNNGTENVWNVSNIAYLMDISEKMYTIEGLLLFVSEDNYEYGGFTFASSGIYMENPATLTYYVTSITRNPVVKIDEKYLPDNALVGENGSGTFSHVFNYQNQATGSFSTAFGLGNKASSDYQFVEGHHNIEDAENVYAHIVGNGRSSTRSNAHTLDWSGNAWYQGDIYVGGTSQDDESAKKLATTDDIVQSDWNENDESSKAFIKNKPFDKIETESVLVDESTLSTWIEYNDTVVAVVEYNNMSEVSTYAISPSVLALNTTYKVTWDGTEYDLVCFLDNTNGYYHCLGGTIDNFEEYPFSIVNESTYLFVYIPASEGTSVSHTLKISVDTVEYITIDENYIPDTIARQSSLQDYATSRNLVEHSSSLSYNGFSYNSYYKSYAYFLTEAGLWKIESQEVYFGTADFRLMYDSSSGTITLYLVEYVDGSAVLSESNFMCATLYDINTGSILKSDDYISSVTIGEYSKCCGNIILYVDSNTVALEYIHSFDDPLPVVTSDDNGSVLKVVDGVWAKAEAPKEVFMITVTKTSTASEEGIETYVLGSEYTLDKTFEEISSAISAGHLPVLYTPDTGYVFNLSYHSDRQLAFDLHAMGGNEIISMIFVITNTDRVVYQEQIYSLAPAVTSANEGQILSVVNGVPTWIDFPTATDDEVTTMLNELGLTETE